MSDEDFVKCIRKFGTGLMFAYALSHYDDFKIWALKFMQELKEEKVRCKDDRN